MIDFNNYNTACIYYSKSSDMGVTLINCSKKQYDGWSMYPENCVGCDRYINRKEAIQKLEEIGFRSKNKLVR